MEGIPSNRKIHGVARVIRIIKIEKNDMLAIRTAG